MPEFWKKSESPSGVAFEFDSAAYIRRLAEKMAEMEEIAAQEYIVNWLNARGWKVERDN